MYTKMKIIVISINNLPKLSRVIVQWINLKTVAFLWNFPSNQSDSRAQRSIQTKWPDSNERNPSVGVRFAIKSRRTPQQIESERSEEHAEDISDGVFRGGSGGPEETELVGGLFGGAGEEGGDGSERNGVAAKEGTAGEVGQGGEEKSQRKAEENVV